MFKSSPGRVTIAAAGVLGLLAAVLPIAVLSLDSATALDGVYTAGNTIDEIAGYAGVDGEEAAATSLREAIQMANEDEQDSVINLVAGAIYTLEICGNIDEGGENWYDDLDHYGGEGDAEALTINGNGATVKWELDSGDEGETCDRILEHHGYGTLTLNNVTFTLGSAESGPEAGGAVLTNGPTFLNGTTLTGNEADRGGGLASFGANVTLAVGSSVSGNHAENGGGIFMDYEDEKVFAGPTAVAGGSNSDSVLRVDGASSVNDNEAEFNGGGIFARGNTIITGASTVLRNVAGVGSDENCNDTQGISASGCAVGAGPLPGGTAECHYGDWDSGYGGGIRAYGASVTVAGGSQVNANVACRRGGGISIYGYGNEAVSVEAGSQVNGNAARNDGGGIHAEGASVSVVGASFVDGNQAGFAIAKRDWAVTIEDGETCPSGWGGGGGGAQQGGGWGTASSRGGGIYYYPSGENDGSVLIDGSSVSSNTACGDGGGIYYALSEGIGDVAVVNGSTIANNEAVVPDRDETSVATDEKGTPICGGCGGGIWAPYVRIVDSAVTGNVADGVGGGVASPGHIDVVRSAITANDAYYAGGGLFHSGDARMAGPTAGIEPNAEAIRVHNSTVSSNSAHYGGGVHVQDYLGTGAVALQPVSAASVVLEFATVAANEATEIEVLNGLNGVAASNVSAPVLDTTASVIALAVGGPNCAISSTASDGYNYSDDTSCGLTHATDSQSATNDPLLGALAGGVHIPSPASPLVDAVPALFGAAPVIEDAACDDTDQRKVTRASGPNCDIGAVELIFPTAKDDTATTASGVPVAIPVLVNDVDPDGSLDPTSVVVVDTITAAAGPSFGVAVVDPVTGVITYTPTLGLSGIESFGYTVKIKGTTKTVAANVTVTVTAVAPDALQPQFTG